MRPKLFLLLMIFLSLLFSSCSTKTYSTINKTEFISINKLNSNSKVAYASSKNTTYSHYEIGQEGPAGGVIFYDCDADNASGNADGLKSSDCGWRYLEVYTVYGGFLPFSPKATNSYVGTREGIGAGKTNTQNLVDALGSGSYAAKSCSDFKVTKDGKTYDDWFLPSEGELNALYCSGLISFNNTYYWSSTERNDNVATLLYAGNGDHYSSFKTDSYNVLLVRSFQTYEFNVGSTGPAGGFIIYDCDADNDTGNADGLISSECGWRYLEAASEPLVELYCFGYSRNYSVGQNENIGTSTALGNGNTNTQTLVSAMGDKTYTKKSGANKDLYAAKACADYSVVQNEVVYNDWFLPSKDELSILCENLKNIGLEMPQGSYWSSSEVPNLDNAFAFGEKFEGEGEASFYAKETTGYVWPVRAFNVCSQGVNHTWSGEKIVVPTCVKAGTRTYTCKFCGQTKTEVLVATGNHTWDTGKVTISATCGKSGTKTFFCKVCGYSREESIKSTGLHRWDNGVVTLEPTCGSEGLKTYTCKVCGQTKQESIPTTENHLWNDGVVTQEPTCTSEGSKTYTCTVCGAEKTESLEPVHSWNEGIVMIAPTCTNKGVKAVTCTICGKRETQTIAPSHDYVNYKCSRCGAWEPGHSSEAATNGISSSE